MPVGYGKKFYFFLIFPEDFSVFSADFWSCSKIWKLLDTSKFPENWHLWLYEALGNLNYFELYMSEGIVYHRLNQSQMMMIEPITEEVWKKMYPVKIWDARFWNCHISSLVYQMKILLHWPIRNCNRLESKLCSGINISPLHK